MSPRAAATTKPKAKKPKKRAQGGPGQALGELPAPLPAGAPGLRPRAAHRDLRRAGLGAAPRPDERADPHDPHPEHRRHERREGVRGAPPRLPQRPRARGPPARHRLGRRRPVDGPPPDWSAVEFAPLPELIDVIRPGGLGPQKAPRIQATLRRHPRGARRLLAGVPRRPAGPRGPRLADADRRHRQEDGVDRARCSASARR